MTQTTPDDRDVEREKAIARVKHYVQMRIDKPLRQCGDSIHGIHAGTEWGAELLLSDLQVVLAAMQPAGGEGGACLKR